MSLNELSNEPHNLWLKCFASRKKVKKQVFQRLEQLEVAYLTKELQWFIKGLMQLWFGRGEENMNFELTPEDVSELGKQMGEIWLANLTVDERLAGLEPKEVLSHFKPKDMLPHFKPADRLAGLEPEVIEDYLKQLKKPQK